MLRLLFSQQLRTVVVEVQLFLQFELHFLAPGYTTDAELAGRKTPLSK